MSIALSGLTAAFKDELNATSFQEHIAEGTLAGLVNTQDVPTKGVHPLQAWTSNLNFTAINVDTPFVNSTGSNGNGVSAFDDYRSTATLTQKDLTVDINVAQGYINPHSVLGSALGVSIDRLNDPSQAFLSGFSENVIAQSAFNAGQRFYTGFGSTPVGGLNAIATNATATLATSKLQNVGTGAVTAANIVGKLTAFIAGMPDSSINRGDIMIVMSVAQYNMYRQAIRAGNYNDPQFQAGATEQGVLSSVWLDNPRITIIGDPAFVKRVSATQGDFIMLAADDTYRGVVGFSDLDDVNFWWNIERKLIGFSIPIGGGVQVGDARAMLVSNLAA